MQQRWHDWYRDHPVEVTKAYQNASHDPRYKKETNPSNPPANNPGKTLLDSVQAKGLTLKPAPQPKSAPQTDPTPPKRILKTLRESQLRALDSAHSSPSAHRVSPFSVP